MYLSIDSKMGQVKSAPKRSSSGFFIVKADHAEFRVFDQIDNFVKNIFGWQEKINLASTNGSVFIDRLFDIKTKTGEIIKLSASFTYDSPTVTFKLKAVEGADLLTGNLKIMLTFRSGVIIGRF